MLHSLCDIFLDADQKLCEAFADSMEMWQDGILLSGSISVYHLNAMNNSH